MRLRGARAFELPLAQGFDGGAVRLLHASYTGFAAGTLTGYAGGLWRKQWLLDHERRYTGQAQL